MHAWIPSIRVSRNFARHSAAAGDVRTTRTKWSCGGDDGSLIKRTCCLRYAEKRQRRWAPQWSHIRVITYVSVARNSVATPAEWRLIAARCEFNARFPANLARYTLTEHARERTWTHACANYPRRRHEKRTSMLRSAVPASDTDAFFATTRSTLLRMN